MLRTNIHNLEATHNWPSSAAYRRARYDNMSLGLIEPASTIALCGLRSLGTYFIFTMNILRTREVGPYLASKRSPEMKRNLEENHRDPDGTLSHEPRTPA